MSYYHHLNADELERVLYVSNARVPVEDQNRMLLKAASAQQELLELEKKHDELHTSIEEDYVHKDDHRELEADLEAAVERIEALKRAAKAVIESPPLASGPALSALSEIVDKAA